MKSFLAILGIALGGLMFDSSPAAAAKSSIYDFEVKRIGGSKESLSKYRGKVLLLVNTASECGYTPQYQGLQAIYDRYAKEGFEILGFPSNDFGGQEPGSNAEIKNFCERKFKVSFPLFEKGEVKGKGIQPLYSYLTTNAPTKGDVEWNFEKFLVSRDGKIVGRFKSKIAPESDELKSAIEKALEAKTTEKK